MTVSALPEGLFVEGCPTREVLDHVMSRWAPLVLSALGQLEPGAALRWSELRRRTPGVSEKMLAQTLKVLQADGLVDREARPVVPPHVEYSLTPLGASLVEHLTPLLLWMAENAEAMLAGPGAAARPRSRGRASAAASA